MKTVLSWLHKNNACSQSVMWVQENNIKSLQEAWNLCDRGDWLLWMAQRLGVDRRKLALCEALCAHTVVQHMKDSRSREAVRVAFLWGRGKATDAELDSAWHGAHGAFFNAEGIIETSAARVALSAIENADNSDRKYRANTAIFTPDAVYWAVAADRAADAKVANQARTASIIKKLLTEDVMRVLKTIK